MRLCVQMETSVKLCNFAQMQKLFSIKRLSFLSSNITQVNLIYYFCNIISLSYCFLSLIFNAVLQVVYELQGYKAIER